MKSKVFDCIFWIGLLSGQAQASNVMPLSTLKVTLHDPEIVNMHLSPLTKSVRKAFDAKNYYKSAGLVCDAVADGSFSPILAEELGNELIVISRTVLDDENFSPLAISALAEIGTDIRYAMHSPKINRFDTQQDVYTTKMTDDISPISPVGGYPLQSPVEFNSHVYNSAKSASFSKFVLRKVDSGISISNVNDDYDDYADYDDFHDYHNFRFAKHKMSGNPRLKALFSIIKNYQIHDARDIIIDIIKDGKLSSHLAIQLNRKMQSSYQNKLNSFDVENAPQLEEFYLIEKINNPNGCKLTLVYLEDAIAKERADAAKIIAKKLANAEDLQKFTLNELKAEYWKILHSKDWYEKIPKINARIKMLENSIQ